MQSAMQLNCRLTPDPLTLTPRHVHVLATEKLKGSQGLGITRRVLKKKARATTRKQLQHKILRVVYTNSNTVANKRRPLLLLLLLLNP